MAPIQTGGINIVIPYVQIGGNNMSMPHDQDMDIFSTGPNLESTVISYGDNQPTDPNLLDGLFSSLLIFGVKEFLSKDSKNITCSLQRIGTFIQQCSFNPSLKDVLLELKPIISVIWQLLKNVYGSGCYDLGLGVKTEDCSYIE